MNDDLAELLAQFPVDTREAVSMWLVGRDLHYAWFGMTQAEAIDCLERTIAHIRGGKATTVGPSPTKH